MKLDLELFKRLLVIDHPSGSEWPMLSAIINECYKIGGLTFELDNYANILITKNTTNPVYYPMVIAHTDCVLSNSNKQVVINGDIISGRDAKTGKQIGLGSDDTAGVVCAIQLLKVCPNLKVLFTTEEEIGFVGAGVAAENIEFFLDVSYMIQADRHGKHDLITYTNGIYSASKEWLDCITPIMAKFGYSEEYGLGTDVGRIARTVEISGVNISCGYSKEHSNQETTSISALTNCLNFMYKILLTVPLNKQYTTDSFNNYGYYGSYGLDKARGNTYYDDEYDFAHYPSLQDDSPGWDDIPCNNCKNNMDCMNCDAWK